MQTILLGFLTKGLSGSSSAATTEKIIEGDKASNSSDTLVYVGYGLAILAVIGVLVFIGSKMKNAA